MAHASGNFFNADPLPHGEVKGIMWLKYLQSFIAKTQQSRSGNIDKTFICDVFAGPGVYDDNRSSRSLSDYGSPIVSLGAAIEHFIHKNKLMNTFNPISDAISCYTKDRHLVLEYYKIELYFVEKDGQRYESLVDNIILFFNFYGIKVSCWRRKKTSRAFAKACVSSIDESFPIRCIISNCEFAEFPAPEVPDNARMVTFIDPFGFSMIPWENVSQFVGERKELLINLMTSFMNRFFNKNRDQIGEVFGIDPEELEVFRTEDQGNFLDTLADLYIAKLQTNGVEYALTFEMRNKGNVRLYHLIFATTHMEGLKSMKESFNRGTQEPDRFSLSDYKIIRKNIPLDLGNNQDPKEVAEAILNRFEGMIEVSLVDIERFVWLDTPYVYRKKPLAILEKNRKIVDVVGINGERRERRFTFPDKTRWLISFAQEQEQEQKEREQEELEEQEQERPRRRGGEGELPLGFA